MVETFHSCQIVRLATKRRAYGATSTEKTFGASMGPEIVAPSASHWRCWKVSHLSAPPTLQGQRNSPQYLRDCGYRVIEVTILALDKIPQRFIENPYTPAA